MNALELFSGTHSVGKVLEEKGYNVISVDICDYKGKYPPTHKVDILEFDYKQYPKDHFKIIWSSPPCVYYTSLAITNIGRTLKDGSVFTREILEGKRKEMDKLVMKVKEIIDYFKPHEDLSDSSADFRWFMENPQTGVLKNRDVVKGLPYYDVDYCMYCNWGSRKRTRIWTNITNFIPKLCDKKCGNMVGNRHKNQIGTTKKGYQKIPSKLERYRIPPKLIEDLISP